MEKYNFEKLKQHLTIKGYSKSTINHYLYYNIKFLDYTNKSPKNVCENDIKKFLNHLATEKQAASSTLNLAYSALKTYYSLYYKRKFFCNIPRSKKKQKLPVVLAKKEILDMIKNTENPKHQTMILLLYGCGLRISELIKIKIKHIKIDRKMLLIEDSKGGKDRYVKIPEKLLKTLQNQIILKDGNTYLFTNRNNKKMTKMSIYKVVKNAGQKAGINHSVYPHILRHSFATHLLEAGTDIRYIQELLGHTRLETTQIYTKVAQNMIEKIESPVD